MSVSCMSNFMRNNVIHSLYFWRCTCAIFIYQLQYICISIFIWFWIDDGVKSECSGVIELSNEANRNISFTHCVRILMEFAQNKSLPSDFVSYRPNLSASIISYDSTFWQQWVIGTCLVSEQQKFKPIFDINHLYLKHFE